MAKTFKFIRPATGAQIGDTATADDFKPLADGKPGKFTHLGDMQRLLELQTVVEVGGTADPDRHQLPPAEPVFLGKKLSEFDGVKDAEILKLEGANPDVLKEIRAAQKKAGK